MTRGWSRAWKISLGVAAAIFALLLERAAALDREIAALELQLGVPRSLEGPTSPEIAPRLDFEQRLAKLEHALDGLSLTAEAPSFPNGARAPRASNTAFAPSVGMPDDQAILSSLARAQGKIEAQQLDFYRERWLDWRDGVVEVLAARSNMTPGQVNRMKGLFADEIDAWVELIRRPDALQDPDRFAKDWRGILRTTDEAARDVLDPSQLELFTNYRNDERRMLWPWLPAE